MSFQFQNAPFTCQRAVDTVIDNAKYDHALVYVGDCVAYSKTFAELATHLQSIFSRFQKVNLKFRTQKCLCFRISVM